VSACNASFTPCLKPLGAAVAVVFALTAHESAAAVTTCDDDGAGSLRAAIAAANSNDIIDLSGLQCSVISLHTGSLKVPLDNLTVKGPVGGNLTIIGKYNGKVEHDRLFKHTGDGTLTLKNLHLELGYLDGADASGGCVYSSSNLTLDQVVAAHCSAVTASGVAAGGAVYSKGKLTLTASTISSSVADASASGQAKGGGAVAHSTFSIVDSTLSNNTAKGESGNDKAYGGGLFVEGSGTISGSTISANTAEFSGGVEAFNANSAALDIAFINSTISGNSAPRVGAMFTDFGTVGIYNSTVAFNTAADNDNGDFAPGLAFNAANHPVAVTLQSSLIVNNTYGNAAVNEDLSNNGNPNIAFAGADNLVGAAEASVSLANVTSTPIGVCALLGPLRNNGGITDTHALLSYSPAIDAGNQVSGVVYDQRGSPHARSNPGPGSADIGAYERDKADSVFNTSFEGC